MDKKNNGESGQSFMDKIAALCDLIANYSRNQAEENDFDQWREKLLSFVLWGGAVVIGSNFIYSAYFFYNRDRWDLIGMYLLLNLLYLGLAGAKRLPFCIRAIAALSVPLIMGIVVLSQFWLYGSGRLLLLVFSGLASALIGVWAALASILINLAILVTMGMLGESGYLSFPLALNAGIDQWRLFTFTFFSLNMIASLALSLFIKGLREAINKQEELSGTLEADRATLDRTMKMMTRESKERARIEDILEEEKKRSATILERLPAFIVLLAPDFSLSYSNRYFRDNFGEPEGRHCYHLFKGRKTPCPICPSLEIMRGERGSCRDEMLTFSGKIFHVHRYPYRIKGGNTMILKMGFDITPLLEARKAARKNKEKYYHLVENISDIVFTHDLDGRLLSVNHVAEKLFGYRSGEILYKNVSEFMIPKHRSLFEKDYLNPLLKGGESSGVAIFETKSGNERYIEYRNILVREEGRRPYISGSARDVTEKILAERELRWMEEQLTQAQKMEAVGTLSSGIAHDFNNLLQVISGNTQLLLAASDRPDQERNNLREIDRTVESATELTRRLLTFSRNVKSDLRPTDLHHEIVQAVKLLERTIPKMVRIRIELAAEQSFITADPTQIEQIIMNLGLNARDAMDQGGLMTISTENLVYSEDQVLALPGLKPGLHILVTVSDTGQGIARDALEHIFEPFFSTKKAGLGTGLGLSTVYGIVRNHSGHILCRSGKGKGARFMIHFPALSNVEISRVLVSRSREEIMGGDETVLLVDDEQSILDLAENILTQKGYRTISAMNGEEALEIYRTSKHKIDLVILDLGMPGMGGRRCLEELVRFNPEAKVIIASGYTEREGETGIIKAGAAAFLGKPYRLAELLGLVRKILDGEG